MCNSSIKKHRVAFLEGMHFFTKVIGYFSFQDVFIFVSFSFYQGATGVLLQVQNNNINGRILYGLRKDSLVVKSLCILFLEVLVFIFTFNQKWKTFALTTDVFKEDIKVDVK
jgi:hypothetical protein